MSVIQQALRARRGGSPVAHLVAASSPDVWFGDRAYSLVHIPETVQTSGHAPAYGTIDRPGLKPTIQRDAGNLLVVKFKHTIGAISDVTGRVNALQKLAASGMKVRMVGFDPAVRGWFHITDLTVDSTLDEDQRIKHAELSWTLTERVAARVKIGRAIPDMRPIEDLVDMATSIVRDTASIVQSDYSTYVTKSGDTLWKIATVELGDSSRWTAIADLNKAKLTQSAFDNTGTLGPVANARMVKLKPGIQLILPKPPRPASTASWTNSTKRASAV